MIRTVLLTLSLSRASCGQEYILGNNFLRGKLAFVSPNTVAGSSDGDWQNMGDSVDAYDNNDMMGESVAMSGDGQVFACGAPGANRNGPSAGFCRLCRFIEGQWVQIGPDINGDHNNEECGKSVALSGDGEMVAVGSPGFRGNGNGSGKTTMYRYKSNSDFKWIQIGSPIFGMSNSESSGSSLALSDDGKTVAIASPGSRSNGQNAGQVRIYKLKRLEWKNVGGAINGLNNGDRLGFSVALSRDGTKVAAGAPFARGSKNQAGYVAAFELVDEKWSIMGGAIRGGSSNDNSGYDIDFDRNGTTLAIGSPNSNVGRFNSGSARVFKYDDDKKQWNQLGSILTGSQNDGLGRSVTMSDDGTKVAIGGPDSLASGPNSGLMAVYGYSVLRGDWVPKGSTITGSRNDQLGSSVSFASSGEAITIGAPGTRNGRGPNSGSVVCFEFNSNANANNDNNYFDDWWDKTEEE